MTPAWKDDFPISWVDDHFVTRREFTKSLVLVSCSAFAANGALLALGALEKGGTAPPGKPIAGAPALAVGKSLVFEYGGSPCLLIRLDAERFAAFGQKCTHLGCPVVYRDEQKKIHCPCHEGYFDLEGKVLAGPPPRPLPVVTLEKKGDELWATGISR